MREHASDGGWAQLAGQVQREAPLRPELLGWQPDEIVLTRGCDLRPHEAEYCERLIAAFPEARVADRRDKAHNRVSVPGAGSVDRIDRGKRILVLGAVRKPVSPSKDPE